MTVPCITLTQPFASLVVMGLKTIETRPFHIVKPALLQQIKEHGLYIHAGTKKHIDILGQRINCRDLCNEKNYFRKNIGGSNGYDKLPLGAVIGKVEYKNEWATTAQINAAAAGKINTEKWLRISDTERAFGDYSSGRFGWRLLNAQQFGIAIPAKGQLGVWQFELPDHFHVPNEFGGHATFSSVPTKQMIEATDTLAKVAFNHLKKQHR